MRIVPISPTDRVFVLTGAGVSAESGLPTFRGAGGLWRGYRVEDVASPLASARDPLLVWQFYSMRRKVRTEKQPNPGQGSRRVVHMHGRLFQSRCDRCTFRARQAGGGARRSPFPVHAKCRPPARGCDANTYEEQVPRCECGGQIRPHICWFGETPFQMGLIAGELQRCTVFMAVGMSGVVYPAAAFAEQARRGRTTRTYYVGAEDQPITPCSTNVSWARQVSCCPSFFRPN